MAKLARLRVNLILTLCFSFTNSHSLITVFTPPPTRTPAPSSLVNHCATILRDQGFYTNKEPIFIFKQYFARTHTKLI